MGGRRDIPATFWTVGACASGSCDNLAYWILQNRDDAEDAVQDAYIRAFCAVDRENRGCHPPGPDHCYWTVMLNEGKFRKLFKPAEPWPITSAAGLEPSFHHLDKTANGATQRLGASKRFVFCESAERRGDEVHSGCAVDLPVRDKQRPRASVEEHARES